MPHEFEQYSIPFYDDKETLNIIYLAIHTGSFWFWTYKEDGRIITTGSYSSNKRAVWDVWQGGYQQEKARCMSDPIEYESAPPVLSSLRAEYLRH
jgi:hypothetical protein